MPLFKNTKLANVSFARAAQPIVRCSPITCRDREGSRFTAPSLVRWCRWNQSETLRRPQRCGCPPIPIDRPRTTVLPGWEVQMPMRALQGAGRGELRSHGTCGPNVRSRASNTPRATFPALLSRDDCESNAASALAADRFTRMRLRACCVRHTGWGHRPSLASRAPSQTHAARRAQLAGKLARIAVTLLAIALACTAARMALAQPTQPPDQG